jgi:hypothetical protein
MTAEQEPGGEVVPLHAVPAQPGDDIAPATSPPVYADITAAGQRRPIVPAPLRRENLRGTITVFAGLQWYRTRYHGLRFLFYAVAVLAWSLVGAARLAGLQLRWWWLAESSALRSSAVIAGDSKEWRSLHKEARETRRVRTDPPPSAQEMPSDFPSDPGEHVTDGRRKPLAAPSRRDTPVVERACDGPQ